jgi:glycosyltransferase involved in cell wall biosynthesis
VIEGQDIVCVSFVTWDDHWGTSQQQMSRLAAKNRVFFVDQPISPLSFVTGVRTRSAVWRQFKRWLQGPRRVQDNVWAGSPPPILPFRTNRAINRINATILRRWLRQCVKSLGMSDVIYWNFEPGLPGLGSAVSPSLSVFHCVDDFSAIPYWWHSGGNQKDLEALCCRESDVVICTGNKLVESRKQFNSNIHFVPEGADVDAFLAAASGDTSVPEAIALLPGPVVGYVGVIDFRLDTRLVAHLATARPAWSFALVGPIKGDTEDLSTLQALPNVHFLGRQPLEAVPGFVKGMDACLIPYVLNDYTHHIFPLKLYEYMAAGKPIVATAMEEMLPYEGAEMAIGRSFEDFLAKVDEALAGDSHERARDRMAAAREHSWDHRVEAVSEILGPMLRDRARSAPVGEQSMTSAVSGQS